LKTREVRFAAIDFESAGTAPGLTDEPVQIAVVHWNGESLERVLDSYLKPSRPVTWAAREVHGISDEMLRGAPALIDLWPQARAIYPSLESHALGETSESLGLAQKLATWENFRWHDAASDAAASLVLLEHLVEAANLHEEPAEILTRPSLKAYLKTRRK